MVLGMLAGPGGDLLSHVLRRSTMGAAGFHGRVREGIGWFTCAVTTRSSKHPLFRPGPPWGGGRGRDVGWQALAWAAALGAVAAVGVEVDRAIRTGKLERVAALAHPAYRRGGLPRL